MVDYSLCVCYGFVVDGEVLDKVESYYDYNDEIEDFLEEYARLVNQWTGRECFVGLYKTIFDRSENIRDIDDSININIESPEVTAFKSLLTKLKIAEIIGEDTIICRKMLINFCY